MGNFAPSRVGTGPKPNAKTAPLARLGGPHFGIAPVAETSSAPWRLFSPNTLSWWHHPTARARQTISAPGDASERQADRMAGEAMHPDGPPSAATIAPVVPGPAAASGRGGVPLSADVRSSFERHFGHDLGHVRLHTDRPAAASARAFGAHAYTTGSDIVFGAGQYAPSTPAGKRLLAHELAHVVQQRERGVAPGEMIQRDAADGGGASLEQRYQVALREARATGDWQAAAELLNGFNHQDIQAHLAQLTSDEVSYLHIGATSNPRVGPASQVAQLTVPGTPPASTVPNASTPVSTPEAASPTPSAAGPTAAPGEQSVATMSATQKLVSAFQRAKINAAVRQKILTSSPPRRWSRRSLDSQPSSWSRS